MDRAIPAPGNEEIDLYLRTAYSLLRSSGEIEIRSLEETHSGMKASLHQQAAQPELDLGAFTYSAMRLPPCISRVRLVLLAQSVEVFARRGFPKVAGWTPVKARARRRQMVFDGRETLAVFINSISDIDDLLPMLTAYQIEWNKMHAQLERAGLSGKQDLAPADFQAALACDERTMDRFRQIWGDDLSACLGQVAQAPKRFAVRLLAGSYTDYRRATEDWWRVFNEQCPIRDIQDRPVYFISSNMHAFPNLLSSYTRLIEAELITFLAEKNPEGLYDEYCQLKDDPTPGLLENLYYYVLRPYLRQPAAAHHYQERLEHEISLGIHNARRPLNLDVRIQVYEVARLNPDFFDPRLRLAGADWGRLRRSRALVINVDYPLGMAAYQVLSQVSANVGELRGVYILGKAATLNGRVGDVMIPNVVYDEHSQNTFLFRNIFEAHNIAPYLQYGTVMDNQKAVTLRGTFLQNREFMHLFYKEGYTDIEMEAGPYLCAMYENVHPKRYPINEIVNLSLNIPCDLGILHYASDTPYSKRQSLLSKSLLYFGVDATYAAAAAIMRRILHLETVTDG